MILLVIAGACAVALYFTREGPTVPADDWTLPLVRVPVIDRTPLLDIPFVSELQDEWALAYVEWCRGLPEAGLPAGGSR